jgi:hypothetical protein
MFKLSTNLSIVYTSKPVADHAPVDEENERVGHFCELGLIGLVERHQVRIAERHDSVAL